MQEQPMNFDSRWDKYCVENRIYEMKPIHAIGFARMIYREQLSQNRNSLVYIAVPYSHPHAAVRQARFEAVNSFAAKLMRDGLFVYSPISHTHPIAVAGDLPLNWEYWEAYDRSILAHCKKLIVLKLDGWETSKGVAGEIAIAKEFGIEIEYIDELPVKVFALYDMDREVGCSYETKRDGDDDSCPFKIGLFESEEVAYSAAAEYSNLEGHANHTLGLGIKHWINPCWTNEARLRASKNCPYCGSNLPHTHFIDHKGFIYDDLTAVNFNNQEK